jgi:hypothetical protein
MDAPHLTPQAASDAPLPDPQVVSGSPHVNPAVAEAIPHDTPAESPKKRKDQRPTLTFKGEEFGPEFRALINKAAERSGMSQAQFVAETLRREAQRIIKGNPADNPVDPAVLPALQTERLDRQEHLIGELTEQVRRLVEVQTAAQKATLWARLRGVFGGATRGVPSVQGL